MYIPCSNENSPARLSVRVLEARNLPIMDKSNDTTDAFVEVFLGSQIYKTEICCKNLSPIWNSEEFIFETDEQSLFDNHLSFRIMDHDTYSANDAIGRIFFDVNMLVARIRHSETETYFTEISAWLPIYDTILGLRGELHVYISLKLLVLNATAKYIHVLSTKIIPPHLRIVSILGLLSDIQTISDPEYQWIDRIRSPRASNEARQYIIRKSLRDLARNIARKAYSLGANAIFGYNEFADIEGESTGQISFRVYGTALKLVLCDKEDAVVEKILYPLISLSILPIPYVLGFAAIVCARVVHILEDDDDIDETKKKSLVLFIFLY